MIPEAVDHLVFAAPDLESGVRFVEDLLGVRAIPGGQHPGIGTRNALVSLGPTTYLEIIAPDPEQPPPRQPRPFRIDTLSAPRLVTWAAARSDLDGEVDAARARGVDPGAVLDASRTLPNGSTLSWRLTDLRLMLGGGIVPFLIDWLDSPHPASRLPAGCTLVELRATHPNPADVAEQLAAFGLTMCIDPAAEVGLTALIEIPRGRVELR